MPSGFGQYVEKVGSNRIARIKDDLKLMDDPEEMMMLIMQTLTGVELVPTVGNYYTFIYIAKTSNIEYDQHPLIACTDIQRWGFRGINFHWEKQRNYTWEEIPGQLHIVRKSEINDLRDISYRLVKTSL